MKVSGDSKCQKKKKKKNILICFYDYGFLRCGIKGIGHIN